jgi:protein-S-isoprenylcysteine O-methyltransferase Ste14
MFLAPLLIGFTCNLASAFTAAYSGWWGPRKGSLASVLLRDVLGIPVWGLGFALAAAASSPFLFPPNTATTVAGWLFIAAGAAVIVAALATIRRRSFAPAAGDSLAESGAYARVRHPIHSGTLLEFLGVVLIRPSAALAAACGVGVIWVLLQTRLEEWDLLQRIPGYREYMKRVPRFVPWIK